MKRLSFLCCCICIAFTSFAQIKANKQIARATENYKPNTMAALPIANRDSLELKQLFDNYQQADAVANIALDKLLVKIKTMQAAKVNDTGSEIGLQEIQSISNLRVSAYQILANMINALNKSQKKILENIGK